MRITTSRRQRASGGKKVINSNNNNIEAKLLACRTQSCAEQQKKTADLARKVNSQVRTLANALKLKQIKIQEFLQQSRELVASIARSKEATDLLNCTIEKCGNLARDYFTEMLRKATEKCSADSNREACEQKVQKISQSLSQLKLINATKGKKNNSSKGQENQPADLSNLVKMLMEIN